MPQHPAILKHQALPSMQTTGRPLRAELLQGESALDTANLKNDRMRVIFDEFKEKMQRPTAKLPDDFGTW